MTRFLAAIGTTLLLTTPLLAQSAPGPADCEQIRQAVATYGYDAARRHALANYGIEAVKYGDRCLPRRHKVRG